MQLTRRFTNHAGELFNEFDRLFRHTVGRPSPLPRNFSSFETDQSWILRSDLPGLRKEDLSINVEDGVLNLAGASENDLIATEINQSLRLPKGVLVDGIAVGAINRVPAKGEVRSNMHVGGRPEKVGLTKRDHEICEAIGPLLREKGQVFVGIDVIGDYLTEINITSPTGIQELERFDGVNIAAKIWDAIETRL